jgi:hypothetical protein
MPQEPKLVLPSTCKCENAQLYVSKVWPENRSLQDSVGLVGAILKVAQVQVCLETKGGPRQLNAPRALHW